MKPATMQKMAIITAILAIPLTASATQFTVPAIIALAQAQPATPPTSVVNPTTAPVSTPATNNATSSGMVSTPNGGVMTALPDHPPPPLTMLSPNVPLTPRQQQAATIAHRWRTRRSSPSEGPDGSVRFMFGASIPSVVCSPLYVCTISLQPGEIVNDIKAGDTGRWIITPSTVGSGATAQTIISVKPADAGLRTNLVIATTSRLYEIMLVSNSLSYTGNVSFTYPEDVQSAWQQYKMQTQQHIIDTTMSNNQNLAALDFNYSMHGDHPSWHPIRIYSDGIKTYIQFPRAMLSGDGPALVSLANDGDLFSSPTKQIVNYRVEGDTYVVDRVLQHAALISGVGSNQDKIEILHHGERN
jgi:P-type conjugative transfer protein TrbG